MIFMHLLQALAVPTAMAMPVDAPPAYDSLIAALQQGGYVVVFRHAHTDRSKMDDRNWSRTVRTTQRNLSDRGAEDARLIGRAAALLRISFSEVLASPMFRTRETAEYAFGTADTTELLRSRSGSPDARALLTTSPRPGTNRVLVTHNAYINRHFTDAGHGRIGEGDAVVVRPLGDDRFEVIGRITLEQWLRLGDDADARDSPAAAHPSNRPPWVRSSR